jgi:hypothetical protein
LKHGMLYKSLGKYTDENFVSQAPPSWSL